MQLTLDGNEVPMTGNCSTETCENCNAETPDQLFADYGMCSECFINDDCPDTCNEPHAEADPNRYGQWTCPTTDTLFRYDTNYGWETDRYNDGSTEINGDFYSDPYDSGWSRCDDCGEWVDSDYLQWSDHDEQGYCDNCFGDHHGGEEADYNHYAECAVCYTNIGTATVLYIHATTEATYCATHGTEPGLIAVAA